MSVPNVMEIDPMVVKLFHTKSAGGSRGKLRGLPKSVGFSLWAPWISAPNFMTIHVAVIDIFQSGAK